MIGLLVSSSTLPGFSNITSTSTQEITTSKSEVQNTNRAADIASGTFGTSDWRIDSEGVLHIGEGKLGDSVTGGPYWRAYAEDIKKIILEGKVSAARVATNLFAGLSYVETIENFTYLDTSATEVVVNMFYNMSALKALDLSSFDTTNVDSM